LISRAEAQVLIQNRLGLHARSAAALVKVTNRYPCEVTIAKDGLVVNGKSIMGVMMLGASKGTRLTLRAEGSDAEALIAELVHLIDQKFYEE
jgi:phosphocarrier protein